MWQLRRATARFCRQNAKVPAGTKCYSHPSTLDPTPERTVKSFDNPGYHSYQMVRSSSIPGTLQVRMSLVGVDALVRATP